MAQEKAYEFPSRFGSHQKMVDAAATEDLAKTTRTELIFDGTSMVKTEVPNDDLVVCKDEHGYYVTAKNRLDTGDADPNRYSSTVARDLGKWGLDATKFVQPKPAEEGKK